MRRRHEPAAGAISTRDIDGKKFDVFLTDGGRFYTDFDGERVESSSMKGLTEQLKRRMAQRPVKVAIPLTLVETDHYKGDRQTIKITQITVVGSRQSGRYNKVATYVEDKHPDEEPETLNRWGDERVCRRLTGEEIQEAVDLYNAYKRAEQAWEDWKAQNKVDPVTKLEEEQERLRSLPQAPPAEEPKHRTRIHPDFDEMNREILGEEKP